METAIHAATIAGNSITKPKRSQQYPPPLVIKPLQQHRQSFIILHGRGSNANTFGPELLQTKLPNGQTFQEALPEVKFIFPTASFRRATAYGRIPITQWFDNFTLDMPCRKEHLQVEGLRESVSFVHSLIQQEIELVGSENVILGGLSQGCATALTSLLLWTGQPVRAAFGMSGWLPFSHLFEAEAEGYSSAAAGDIFETLEDVLPESNESNADHYCRIIQILRDELEIQSDSPSRVPCTSIIIGHGVEDEKVPVRLGQRAADALRGIGCEVSLHTYEKLGHWYHGGELADIIGFIERSKPA